MLVRSPTPLNVLSVRPKLNWSYYVLLIMLSQQESIVNVKAFDFRFNIIIFGQK